MSRKECTIVHVTREVQAISRAGQIAGVSNIAKLCGVTVPRVRGVLRSAVGLGMLYTYNHQYRKNVSRVCYAVTDLGLVILQDIDNEMTILKAIEGMTNVARTA